MAGYAKQRDSVRGGQIALSIAYGVLHSFLCAAVFLLMLTSIVFFTDFTFDGDMLNYVMVVVTLVSVFSASFVAGYKLKTKGWLVGLLIGFLYASISALIGTELANLSGSYLLLGSKYIFGMLAGALGGIIGVNV